MQNNLAWSDAGKLGKCIQFNGNANQILSFSNVPKKANNFTWACWAKQNNRTSTKQYILSNGRDCGSIGFNLYIQNGILFVHMGSGLDDGSTTSTTNSWNNIQELQLNTWYHICCSVNDSSVMVYINGELIKTLALVDINFRSSYESYFTIGKMAYGHRATTYYFPFDGYIQDVRVYNTCLSPRQIKEISKGLVCHYPLGEIDGKIGGRNLIKNGKGNVKAGFFKNFPTVTDEYAEFTIKSKKTYSGINLNDGFVYGCREYDVGEKYTWSYDIMYTDWNFPTGSNRTEFWMGQRYTNAPSGETATGTWSKVTQHNLPVVGQNGCELNKWYHVKQTVTIPDPASSNVKQQATISFYNSNADVEASFTARIKNVKLEKSSTATPWTPAPEDNASFYDNVIYDTSGYCNNGSVSGDILWDTDTPRYKGAYDFNGTGYIYNDNLNLTTTAFTISFWIKIPSTITHQHFDFATFNSWASEGIGIYWDASGQTSSSGAIFGEDSKGDKIHVAVQCKGKLNEWTHFAITWDGTKVYRYSNGIKFSESDFNVVSVYHPRLWLGNSTFGDRTLENSESCMSDFRFYATALSDSDILELYQSSASVDNCGNLMLSGEVIEE